MIASLHGIIRHTATQLITVEVAGVGFVVGVPDERIYSVGDTARLEIYFHWNAENGPQLFGFSSDVAKTTFSLILSVSGLGPKIGLAVLSSLTPEQFLQAIALADIKTLSSVSGIGAKKAELIIMQLRDKAAKVTMPGGSSSQEGATLTKIKEISDALSSLNYSRAEVTMALDYIKKNFALQETSFDELLRKSLTFLSRRG